MQQRAMEAQKCGRAAEVTQIIQISRDARDEEHRSAVSRQVIFAGTRQCKRRQRVCNWIQASALRAELCSQRCRSDDGQRIRHNTENQRQWTDGFAIHLSVNRASADRFASNLGGFPGVNSAHLAEFSEPKRGQASEVAKTAAGGVRDHLERIFEQTCAGSDFEWPSIIHGSAHHHDGSSARLPVAMDVHLRKAVTDELFEALDPVSNHARAFFQSFVDPIDNCAVRTGTANGKKVATGVRKTRGMISVCGYGNTDGYAADDTIRNQSSRVRNVPWNSQFFSKDIGCSGRKQSQRNLASGEPVDDFVDRTVAAAGDYHAAVLFDRVARKVFSMTTRLGR